MTGTDEDPELEDELLPPARPAYGAYRAPMEFLHAARLSLDAGLIEPARMLARESAEIAAKAAAAQRERFTQAEEAQARTVGLSRDGDPMTELVDDLAFLAGAIERRVRAE